MKKQDATRIYSLLKERYPDARESPESVCRGTPFEVLILTILSAQTTDRAVLKVKGPLFSRYPTPGRLAEARARDVEAIIHSLGYYHAKAKNIVEASRALLEKFNGTVPATMEELLLLPGVGRKTANIVLFHGYGKSEGIAVDTHVRRLAQRIGFSDTDNVSVIERDLMALFPRTAWGEITDILIAHGRAACGAKRPACNSCPVARYCRYFHQQPGGA